jgi:hypothetical protein
MSCVSEGELPLRVGIRGCPIYAVNSAHQLEIEVLMGDRNS